MKTYIITTYSNSVYKIEEREDGKGGVRYSFGAIETPNAGEGTRFLGAQYEVALPSPWPVTVGDRLAVFARDKETFPTLTGMLITSRVKSILIKDYEAREITFDLPGAEEVAL